MSEIRATMTARWMLSPRQYASLAFKVPIVVDKDGVIVAGHTRYKAAQKIGLASVPCIVADDLTPEQIKAFRLADNKTAELAEWDFNLLDSELADIDMDMSQFGFDLDEDEPQDVVEDDYTEDVEPRSKLGDVWQLGDHRLICGDSTNPSVIEKLMDGQTARMLFTSPPYADILDYGGGKDLSVSKIVLFITACKPFTNFQCVNLGLKRKDGEIVQYWDEYISTARNNGYKLMAWNVWDKLECGSIGQQSAFIPIRHEWVFVFGTDFFDINKTLKKKPESVNDNHLRTVRQKDGSMRKSSRGDTTSAFKQMESVLQLSPEKGSIRKEHPATFPVALPGEYIKAMSDEADNIIEPFCGSGSTLIACEQLNRICFACELDPHYCDVIINRWETLTGKKAVLLERL